MVTEYGGRYKTSGLDVNGTEETIIIGSFSNPKNPGGSYTVRVWIEAQDIMTGKTLKSAEKTIKFQYNE